MIRSDKLLRGALAIGAVLASTLAQPVLAQSGGGNLESPGNTCRLGPADQMGISGAALGAGGAHRSA